MDTSAAIENMEAVLRAAGTRLRALKDGNARVLTSEGRDIKLEADLIAESVILDGLAATSDLPVLSEEKGWQGTPPGEDGLYWLVDPLDGSYNFLRDFPLCCSAIALCRGTTPLAGAIYDFNGDVLYAGGIGVAATANGQPIRVAATATVGQACVMTGMPVGGVYDDAGLSRLAASLGPWKKVRMIGTATLSLAYVAAGRADFYHENGIFWWDVAAGLAIIEAAGGKWSVRGDAMQGAPLEVKAGVPAIFDAMNTRED
ncbi:MAG: inositol monophosphatase family protein [Alphaproteobacteria bacterium]|nr:MAG: inositol monophosphatase family protein [Alphaproteobacteria bacterium]